MLRSDGASEMLGALRPLQHPDVVLSLATFVFAACQTTQAHILTRNHMEDSSVRQQHNWQCYWMLCSPKQGWLSFVYNGG